MAIGELLRSDLGQTHTEIIAVNMLTKVTNYKVDILNRSPEPGLLDDKDLICNGYTTQQTNVGKGPVNKTQERFVFCVLSDLSQLGKTQCDTANMMAGGHWGHQPVLGS